MGIKKILAAGLLIACWLPLSVGAQVVLEAADGPQAFRFQRFGRRVLPDSLAWQPDSGVVAGWNALNLVPQDTLFTDLQPATWQQVGLLGLKLAHIGLLLHQPSPSLYRCSVRPRTCPIPTELGETPPSAER